MAEYRMLIGGELVAGASTMPVINPATEESIADCPRASAAQVNAAVAAAKAAFPGWSATPIAERRKALLAIADAIQANATELARTLTLEQGKPIGDATGEVMGTAYYFRFFAEMSMPIEVLEESEGRRIEAHRKPLGVVAAIVPWNFPLLLMSFKVPAALLAGNTVIVKPAATTPLSTLMFAALASPLLPPGVLNVVSDANDLGGLLTTHPDVRKISFTGSTATGMKVMSAAAAALKRVSLELGGNDAAIVLGDVDPKEVAPKLFGHAFANNGQVCIAMKRLYVHDDVYEAICSELATLADAAIVGDGLKQGTQLGPLQNKAQFEKVKALIDDARGCGKIIAGGEAPEPVGYFIRPTIVRDITDGTRLVDEEQFGPVLPVIRFTDPSDVIARANASPYGLGASVWSKDVARAYAIADQIDAGTVWVNKHMDLSPGIPFGGAKQSGMGIELGKEGLAEFTQLKVINVAR